MSAHWEHGYRTHGYWDDETGKRLGAVGLQRHGHHDVYRCWTDAASNRVWEYKTLRAAKRRVEREVFCSV